MSFNRQSLHSIGDIQNPYEQAISIIGRTLSDFDEDNLIPCFGFGDGKSMPFFMTSLSLLKLNVNDPKIVAASTRDKDVFSFFPDGRPCNGFEEVLSRYREIVPGLRLMGSLTFCSISFSWICLSLLTSGWMLWQGLRPSLRSSRWRWPSLRKAGGSITCCSSSLTGRWDSLTMIQGLNWWRDGKRKKCERERKKGR